MCCSSKLMKRRDQRRPSRAVWERRTSRITEGCFGSFFGPGRASQYQRRAEMSRKMRTLHKLEPLADAHAALISQPIVRACRGGEDQRHGPQTLRFGPVYFLRTPKDSTRT